MPLSYRPKDAMSPKLARVMQELSRLCLKNGLMAALTISDGHTGEFFITLDPDWSCCKMDKLPDGRISVRVRAKREDYKSADEQKKHIERTVNGLASMFKMVEYHRESLASLMDELRNSLRFSHYGEEVRAHNAEGVPNPDKPPTTLEEAANLIQVTLDQDQLKWIRETPLYDAMKNLHHGFGRDLRNSWNLHIHGNPLAAHVKERLGLWGHGDDLSTLIFTALWSRVRGEPKEALDAALELEAEGMKVHWRQHGVNPETGEKGLVI